MSLTSAGVASANFDAAPKIHKWPAATAAMLGMMTTIMASTMVNVAIADIMGAFGVGQDQVHWLQTGFLSATTVFMLLNAWFVNNFGMKRTFLMATAAFTAAGVFGQLVPTFEGVIAARVVQGACAGTLQPLSLSVIFAAFPPEERGKAMGIFGVGTMLGPALGPLYGGIIIDNLDWRYVFTGAIPFMAIGGVLAYRYLPGRGEEVGKGRFNWVSLVLVVTAITSFLNGINHGQREAWDTPLTQSLLLVAALSTMAFIEVESRTKFPLLNVRLFTFRSFAVVTMVGFVFGVGMFGSFYLMPVFLRTVQGFTGTKAGLLLMYADAITFFVFPVAGWLVHRVKPVYPVAAGMFLFALSSAALSQVETNSGFWFLVGWTAVGRVGLGLAIPALTAAALHDLDKSLLSYGAGTMTFIRMMGGALGVNCLAMVIDTRTAHYSDVMATSQTTLTGTTDGFVDGVVGVLAERGLSSAEQLPYAMLYLNDVIEAQATALAFQDGYLMLAIAFSIATLLALSLAKDSSEPR